MTMGVVRIKLNAERAMVLDGEINSCEHESGEDGRWEVQLILIFRDLRP